MISELRDRAQILAALEADPGLHLYEIGDLDDFFFPHTRWLAGPQGPPPVALLYQGDGLPVLVALDGSAAGRGRLAELLRAAAPQLPERLYAHVSPGLAEVLEASGYEVQARCESDKMLLHGPLPETARDGLRRLGPADRKPLLALYAASYPGNWFDPRMLETGLYHAWIEDGVWLAAAGVHVFSATYRVAALGNIATHPAHRGRGLGGAVTAAVCRALVERGVAHIGLNVHRDNRAAIACYARLGLTRCGGYQELQLARRAR